jgi:hypothetical protein
VSGIHLLYDGALNRYELPAQLKPATVAPEIDLRMERSPGAESGFAVGDGNPLPAPYELAGEVKRSTPALLDALLDEIETKLATAATIALEDDGVEVWSLPVDTRAHARWSLSEQARDHYSNVSLIRIALAVARLDGPTAGTPDEVDTTPVISVTGA